MDKETDIDSKQWPVCRLSAPECFMPLEDLAVHNFFRLYGSATYSSSWALSSRHCEHKRLRVSFFAENAHPAHQSLQKRGKSKHKLP
jgi:hypothetical protein